MYTMLSFLRQSIPIAPLVVFRILVGSIFLLAVSRTLWYGWVDKFYTQPAFFFHFYGFEWAKPLPPIGMYALFITLWLAALCIAIGLFYRFATVIFFLGFTYTELLDVTHYLNHYYLLSILAFLLIFLPAHRAYSLDTQRHPPLHLSHIPRWIVLVLQFQIAIVYSYAGVAKLGSDWLLEAQPLRIWLARHSDIPFVGGLISQLWVAYFMSWAGALYDLTIPFWLWWKRSRPLAYTSVVLFHSLTWMLFPIGVFPFLMVAVTLVFFAPATHQRILQLFICNRIWNLSKLKSNFAPPALWQTSPFNAKFLVLLLGVHFFIQIFAPLRHLLYQGDVLWTEEGFRFSWKVMLIEKQATAQFIVRDALTHQESHIHNLDHLTPKQEYMMSSQPDLLLQFAHFLRDHYRQQHGYQQPQVFARVYVSLNGRPSRLLLDPNTDLAQMREGFFHKDWILPLE